MYLSGNPIFIDIDIYENRRIYTIYIYTCCIYIFIDIDVYGNRRTSTVYIYSGCIDVVIDIDI